MTKSAAQPRKQYNFRLDAATREALRILSELERRSQGQIIELAVEEYFLKHHEKQLMEKVDEPGRDQG